MKSCTGEFYYKTVHTFHLWVKSDNNNGNFFKQELQILKHTTHAQFTFPMNPVVVREN